MNLVLGLLILGGSTIAVWSGLTDPEGGTLQGLRNLMAGQGNTKHVSATSAAFISNLAGALPNAPATYSDGSNGGAQHHSSAGLDHYTAPEAANPTDSAAGERKRAAVLHTLSGWVGVPYRWGGNSKSGVDCSGLVQQVYGANGIKLPRTSAQQQLSGRRTTRPRAGDLVFFGIPAHHVGIALGDGTMIHAPHTGSYVKAESIAGCAQAMHAPVTYRDVIDR